MISSDKKLIITNYLLKHKARRDSLTRQNQGIFIWDTHVRKKHDIICRARLHRVLA